MEFCAMGIATAKETDMKTGFRFVMVALALAAAFWMTGCTNAATRNVLTVVSVNNGETFFSDLINVADSTKPFIPVDEVPVTFGNVPNGGGPPLQPNSPFSTIVITGYTVTYANGVYSPVSGGLTLRVESGQTATANVILSNTAEKGALLNSLPGTVTTTATIHFTGYNWVDGYNNGESLAADAYLAVQVGDFGDK
jgi:hypothetical protein